MGRRRSKWCYETYMRYRRNGRGQGDLGSYLPWITVHDFPSKGKVVRIRGRKTGRIHHLMSQLEKTYFIMLDNDPAVEDIKEQFPLGFSKERYTVFCKSKAVINTVQGTADKQARAVQVALHRSCNTDGHTD